MNNDTRPLVSVITPTYNRADLLPETIESVLAQDYPNFEYIILDDGSTDNTQQILAKYNDPRLKWETHPNMGETRTVNKGFQMAKGEYIAVVNSDDPILPGFISKVAAFLQQRPEALVVYPDWLMIDEHSNPIKEIIVREFSYPEMLREHHCHVGPGGMIRRRAIELEKGRDPNWRYVGDYEFWLRVALHGSFIRIPETLVCWRSHSGGATKTAANITIAKEHIEVVDTYYNRSDIPQEVKAVEREARCNAHYIAALLCLPEKRAKARILFLRSIVIYPFAPLRYKDLMRSWLLMLRVILLPGWFYRILRKLKQELL